MSASTSDSPESVAKAYWESSIPWTFSGEAVSYEEKRSARYSLQAYMLHDIPFDIFRGKRILEIGSGGGIDSAEFVRNGAQVVSMDFATRGTRTTRDLFKQAEFQSDSIQSEASTLPFSGDVFDCVYSFGVLHHIQNIGPTIAEIARVLKRGGQLICMLYNRNSLLYVYSIIFLHRSESTSDQQLLNWYSERNFGCPYTRAYTKNEINSMLERQFIGIDVRTRFNVIDIPGQRKVPVGISDSLELGWHLIVSASKR